MSAFSDRALADLGPTFQRFAGPLLEPLMEAFTGPISDADDLLQPAEGSAFGWPTFADIATTPQPWWYGQVVGVPVDKTLSLDAQRAIVLAHPNTLRGTPAAMIAAVQTLLTGLKRVNLVERVGGDPYALQVEVYTPDLIDPATTTAQVLAAATTQKPVGIIITAVISAGDTYADVAGYGTYAAVDAAVPDYTTLATTVL